MVAIALARLLVPLLIPRFPLAIVAALVLDAVDNSLLARFSDVNLGPDGRISRSTRRSTSTISRSSTSRRSATGRASRASASADSSSTTARRHPPLRGARLAAILFVFTNTFEYTLESAAAEFAALLAVNLGLVYIANRFIGDQDTFPLGEGLFFALLGTLVLWLFDAYKPLADARFAGSEQGRATT